MRGGGGGGGKRWVKYAGVALVFLLGVLAGLLPGF